MSISSITEPVAPEPENTGINSVDEPNGENNEEIIEVTDEAPKEESIPEAATPTGPAKDDFLELLLDRIEPVGESKTTPPLKIMIYSLPGAGKTTLLGEIPNNLIIDTEKGRITLEENKKHQPELMAEGVKVLPYKTFEGLELTIQKFHENPEQLASIETISIDTLNNLHKRGLAAVTEREWMKNKVTNNRYVPETEHHTENNELIRRLVQSMVDLDRNIILTAHSRTIEPKNQAARTFPDFSEKLANTITGMVDVVGYMYMANIEGVETRVLKFQPSETIVAKSRLHNLPDNLIDPTWDKIWDAYVSAEAAESEENTE